MVRSVFRVKNLVDNCIIFNFDFKTKLAAHALLVVNIEYHAETEI